MRGVQGLILILWTVRYYCFYEASSKLTATRSPLRTEESEDFGTQETDEGFWEHFSGFLGCVVEEVLWVSQHIEQGLHEFLVLGKKNKRSRSSEWTCTSSRFLKGALLDQKRFGAINGFY